MTFRLLLTACFVFLVLAFPAPSLEQQRKVYKIGISEWTGYPTNVQGFKDAMAAAGFIEGRNGGTFPVEDPGPALDLDK